MLVARAETVAASPGLVFAGGEGGPQMMPSQLVHTSSHRVNHKDPDYISKEEFDETFECASQVSRLLKGSIDNLTTQITARRPDRSKGRNSA